MDLQQIWDKAWAESLAEQINATDFHQDDWRSGGRKSKEKPKGEGLDYWSQAGYEQLQSYVDWMDKSGWQIATVGGKPAIELEVFTDFGGVPVKGFIDVVYETPSLIMVDYKTGSKTPASWLQLNLYAEAMERQYGVRPTHGAFFMTRKGELSSLEPLNRYAGSWFDRLFADLNRARKLGPFLPNLGDNCRICDVAHACYANGGRDSRRYDPDHPEFGVRK